MKEILQILAILIFTGLVFFGIIKFVSFMTYISSSKYIDWEDDKQICIRAKEANSNEIKEYCIEK